MIIYHSTSSDKLSQHFYITSTLSQYPYIRLYLITTCLVPVVNYHHISIYNDKFINSTTSLHNVIFYHNMYTCEKLSQHVYITLYFFTICIFVVINPPMQLNERCDVQFYQLCVLISLYFVHRCCPNISQYVEM